MNSLDLIRMGLKNLFKRKVRTLLTVLGVVIGSASIVTMVSLGYGMKENYKKEIERMGSLTVIEVYQSYGMPSSGGEPATLNDKSIDSMSKISNVSAVTPLLETSMKMVSGRYGAYIQVVGVEPETMEDFGFKVSEGRLLTKDDGLSLVMGSYVPMYFMDMKSSNYYNSGGEPKVDVMNDKLEITFDMSYGERQSGGDPEGGQKNKPKLYKTNVVGLIQEGSQEKDYYVYMNISELKKIMKEYEKSQGGQKQTGSSSQTNTYHRALVKVDDIDNVTTVQEKIKEMGFEAYSLTEYLESMQKTSNTIQMVLGGIGAISLLVAAIGITNTMIMSIIERTREIGVMKVIGASLSDIKRIFLFESGMIGFVGGVLGLGFSELASLVLNTYASGMLDFMGPSGEGSTVSIIPIWLALSVLAFATVIGLISGYYPARRAMRLSAIEAIKTE